MFGILLLGFGIGLQHAMEADHLAAVATLASQHKRPVEIIKHGLTWGLGHATTLLLLAGAVLALGSQIPESLATKLEAAVGAMLVLLGAQVLYRLWRDRVHAHVHDHADGRHVHLHDHRHDDAHEHAHGFRWRTWAVGLMHGMAGSAALLLLALSKVREPLWGVAYIAVFGIGSMLGMGALSVAIAVPLSASARFLTVAHRALQAMIGVATIGLGLVSLHRNLP